MGVEEKSDIDQIFCGELGDGCSTERSVTGSAQGP